MAAKGGRETRIGRYRAVYFALCKDMGVDEDARHALNERVTMKESTREFDARDWDLAVAELQRLNGQHNDAHAHVRTPRPHGLAREGGAYATWAQCRAIEDLADAIEWRLGRTIGPLAYVCRHHLAGEHRRPLRRQLTRIYNRGSEHRGGCWRVIPRATAGGLIQALRKMGQHYPAGGVL